MLDQCDRLVLFADERIYQRQIACCDRAMKRVLAFWLEAGVARQFGFL